MNCVNCVFLEVVSQADFLLDALYYTQLFVKVNSFSKISLCTITNKKRIYTTIQCVNCATFTTSSYNGYSLQQNPRLRFGNLYSN